MDDYAREHKISSEDAGRRLRYEFFNELAKEYKPYGLEQNKEIAKMGGNTAKVARDDIEKKLGKTVISNKNSLDYQYLEENTKITNSNK